METQTIFTVLAPLAFAVGFALQKGNVCSVLAAREIAQTGKSVRLKGLLLTSAWAFFILLPITWYNIGPFQLSQQFMPGPITILAGILYAFGCYLTGACIFGICSRTTAGHISFVFAIPAMAFGAILGQSSGYTPKISERTTTFAADPVPWSSGSDYGVSDSGVLDSGVLDYGVLGRGDLWLGILWLIALVWLARSAYKIFRAHQKAGVTLRNLLFQSRWRSAFAAAIIGLIGTLLFATETSWFYPAATVRLGLYLSGLQSSFPLDSVVGGVSVFAGGIAAALMKGRVLYRPPHLLPSLQALIGGTVIGFAWAHIPGGNDSMVLFLLPSLALNGIVAYVSMLLTLIAIEKGKLHALSKISQN